MEEKEFMSRVKRRLGVLRDEPVLRSVRVTLEVLGRHLSRADAATLASLLPPGLSGTLQREPHGEHLTRDGFVQQVEKSGGATERSAAQTAGTVTEAIVALLGEPHRHWLTGLLPEGLAELAHNEPVDPGWRQLRRTAAGGAPAGVGIARTAFRRGWPGRRRTVAGDEEQSSSAGADRGKNPQAEQKRSTTRGMPRYRRRAARDWLKPSERNTEE